MSPPFISDYKKLFAVKRICQTLCGGPRLYAHPMSIIIQITIFTLPALLLSIVRLVDDSTDVFWRCLVVGVSLVLMEIFLNFSLFLLKKGHHNVAPSESLHNFLAEEDQNDYEGFFKGSTWIFIAPNASVSPIQIVAIFSSSFAFALCTPLVFHQEVSPVLRGFGIFSLCIARYSAVISVAPELATFDPIRKIAIRFYRPFYTGVIGAAYLAAIIIAKPEVDSSTFVFVLLLALLPILWTLGILPPLDSLLPWTFDSIARCFGGVPSFHYFGTVISIGVGVIAAVLAFVAAGQSPVLLIILQCVFGYVMSSDIGAILNVRSSLCEEIPAKTALLRLLKPTLAILTSICVLILSIFLEIRENYREVLIATSLSIALSSFAIRHLLMTRKFPSSKLLLLLYAMWDGVLMYILQVWISIELTVEESKRSLSVQSLLNLVDYMLTIRAFSKSTCHPKMTALDLSLTCIFKHSTSTSMSGIAGIDWTQVNYITSLFLVSHVRRMAFRGLRFLRMILVVWHAFLVTPLLEPKWKVGLVAFCAYPISLISLVMATLVDGSTLVPIFTLPIFLVGFPRPTSFWTGRWFPKSAGTKTQITGNEADGKSLDWTIYAQIAPILTRNLVRKAYKARMRLDEGNYFVARYEDRLIFLRVITSGWNFVYIQVKGLEMQEQTSCHHQEAAWIDEYLEKAFGHSDTSKKSCPTFSTSSIRSLCLSTVRPQTTVIVSTYAESKSMLNSLKSREEFLVFQHMFCRAFSYLWIKKNPVFKGESYQRPIASGYHFVPPGGSSIINISDEGSLDEKDSDDDEEEHGYGCGRHGHGHGHGFGMSNLQHNHHNNNNSKFSMSRALFDCTIGNMSAIHGNTFNGVGGGAFRGGGGGGRGSATPLQNSLVAPVIQMVMPHRDNHPWGSSHGNSNGVGETGRGGGGLEFPYLPGMGGDATNNSASIFGSGFNWRDDPMTRGNDGPLGLGLGLGLGYNDSNQQRMTMTNFYSMENGASHFNSNDDPLSSSSDLRNNNREGHVRFGETTAIRPPLTQSSSISSSASSPPLSNSWPGLNDIWVKKCVGEAIPSNAVKVRVEKLCLKAWRIILGRDEDIVEIDLAQFFKEDFWKKWSSSRKLTKLSSLGKISMEEITVKAFRYAAKLTLDEIYSGSLELDGLENIFMNNEAKEEEIFHELTLYEKNHKFCSPRDIAMHVDDRQKHIVSMSKADGGQQQQQQQQSQLRLLNFDAIGVEFRVGRVFQYCVEGIWTNLNLELLYLTSDDDERFSIQHDRYLLRNIITQCANSPLGYAVYDSTYKVNLFDNTIQPVT